MLTGMHWGDATNIYILEIIHFRNSFEAFKADKNVLLFILAVVF